jgi:protein-S-isoprenylcysteine O-methyltransferase Ste14
MDLKTNIVRMIFSVATGSRKLRMLLTPATALSFFIFATLLVMAFWALDRALGLPLFPPYPFARAKGTPVPFSPPPALVTSGLYSYVRHPMMSGVYLAIFGLGMLLKSIMVAFIFTPVFILLSVLEIKMIEEPELEMRLGKVYLGYKKKTPMFIPKLKRSPGRGKD